MRALAVPAVAPVAPDVSAQADPATGPVAPPVIPVPGATRTPKGAVSAWLDSGVDTVRWSIALAGLMTYVLVITSYSLPVGKLAIASGLLSVFAQKGGVRIPTYLRWLGAFLSWVWVTSFYMGRNEWTEAGTSNMLTMTLIVLVAANAFRTRGQLRVFMLFFMVCFIVFPMRGAVLNYFFGQAMDGRRAVWIMAYNNPNDLAAMSLLQISLAASLLVSERKVFVRWFAVLDVFLMVLMILMTQSRGVFIGLVAFGGIVFMTSRTKLKMAAQLMAAMILIVGVTPPSAWKRLATLTASTESIEAIDGEEGSASERREIWQVAKKIIREHKVMGVGIGAYKPNHESYAYGGEFSYIAHGKRDTHSLYLNVIAETGYVGLALYLGFVGSILLYADRTRRRIKAIAPDLAREILMLEAGTLAFLAACTFGTLPYLPHFLLQLVMLHSTADLRNEAFARAQAGVADAPNQPPHAAGRAQPAGNRRAPHVSRGRGQGVGDIAAPVHALRGRRR